MPNFKTISKNKKAYHDYFVLEDFEAGIELVGTEVKSIRNGNVNLKDSHCAFRNNELYVVGMHISPYEKGNIFNKDPMRRRKLLLHKKELRHLNQQIMQKGLTLVPTSIYLKDALVKISIALCQGKKLYDKRDTIAQRDVKREMDRTIKSAKNF